MYEFYLYRVLVAVDIYSRADSKIKEHFHEFVKTIFDVVAAIKSAQFQPKKIQLFSKKKEDFLGFELETLWR